MDNNSNTLVQDSGAPGLRFFDTHAHLNDEQLIHQLDQLLAQADEAHVDQIVAIGTDMESSRQCLDIANATEGVFSSVGIHPNGCHRFGSRQWSEVIDLTIRDNVVALGETGLDCYWDDTPLEVQRDWFRKHIELSHETGLPLVVHQRESETPILEMLDMFHHNGKVNGIMHSFTGSLKTAEKCLDYGMYISFAGMVTFKNAQAIREVAKCIPQDRILIETDSPYLTPHPHRGKRPNHPAMVVHTAACLAETRGEALAAFAKMTTNNAKRVFKLNQIPAT